SREALSYYARVVAAAQRDRSLSPRLTARRVPGIQAGKAHLGATAASQDESATSRAARTYATAVVTAQRIHVELKSGRYELARKAKRVAQMLVAQADQDARLLVTLATVGRAAVDPASLSVSGAILTIAMTRLLTNNRAILTNAAMVALLYDA